MVETVPVTIPERSWLEKLEEIRQALRQSGYRFRTREEIDAQIQIERDAWEENSNFDRLKAGVDMYTPAYEL